MSTMCGAQCEQCAWKEGCTGCEAARGRCVAAEYIRLGGKEAYSQWKSVLLGEINALLAAEGAPAAQALYELPGSFVNLSYPLPSGETVRLLDEKRVYVGYQVELPDTQRCYGVVADLGFVLLCTYGPECADPELVLYKRR